MTAAQLAQALALLPAGTAVLLSREVLLEVLGGNGAPGSPERDDRHGGRPGTPPVASTNGEPMLTATELARQLNVSARYVYDHQDELGGKRVSPRLLRFPRAAVQRYLEQRRAIR